MIVEFVIPTFDRVNSLRSMLSSLIVQTSKNWSANVVIDSAENPKIISLIKSLECNNIHYCSTEKRYNDWGHTPRDIGKQLSNAEYVIMTGDDNYYAPIFVQEFEVAAKDRPGLIYWDMVHSHYKYTYFKCRPVYNQIDMGAFATRTDLAQQIKLPVTYAADGDFIEMFKKKFPNEKMAKIEKVLFVHN